MVCPSCGKELPGEFPFCPFCGAATWGEPARSAREERKVVTVLFADLVGFTAKSEQMDPEDVRALLAPYHAHVRTELERFGGTVEKFIGDAVMALFGAPAAHEDDPERAVRAALEIRDWAQQHAEKLQLRIGVNTGEALISLDARPSEGEAMAAGDVVNTAARLQSAAPLNGVLVSEQTYRATAHAIDYRPVQPVVAKGKSEPVPAWEATQARSRLGIDVTQEAASPLVGRSRELDLLVSTLARVTAERSSQLVTVVGVPGIGKSRLVHELFRAVEQQSELVRWRQGRSLPYGDGVTFWALSEVVKAEAGMLESDGPEQVEQKLGAMLSRLRVDPAEVPWLERHLRPLAGLAESGDSSLGETFAAWRRLFDAMAEDRPMVLVLEDLHWADDAMLDFVDELMQRATGVPMLVLATARPELLQRRPAWGGGMSNALTISLTPLSDDDTARLLQALLDRPLVDAGLQQDLLARAGGNPLYAEQYARVLAERGGVQELPETVQGIIAARLDALSESEKQLLQDAAVVGKVFWLGAVEAVGNVTRWQAEELLHGLERKEFVQRSRSSSVGSEREYVFRHLLIRDVAYGQIPRATRSQKHQRAAAWIESLGRPDDQAEMLAHHYLTALELADAAGLDASAVAEPARRALRAAGDRAGALYAIEAARRFYDAALRLCPPEDPERPQLLFRRAAPVRITYGGEEDLLLEAVEALLAAGDTTTAAEAEVLVARSLWTRGDKDVAAEHAKRAVRLVEDAPPSRTKAFVLASEASRSSMNGDSAATILYASQAVAMAKEIGWDEGLSESLSWLGIGRVHLGERDGLDDLQRCVSIGGAAGAVGPQSRGYNAIAVAQTCLGDLAAAGTARIEAARLAKQIGGDAERRWYDGVLCDQFYRRGEWDRALTICEAFLAEVAAGSPHYLFGGVAAVRAKIRLAGGDLTGALADAATAAEWARGIDEPQLRYHLLPLAINVFVRAGDRDGAAALTEMYLDGLGQGVELQFGVIDLPDFAAVAAELGVVDGFVAALGDRPIFAWRDVVMAYAAGNPAGAADALHLIGEQPAEAEARLRAAEKLVAEGRRPEADEQLRQALAFYRSVDASRYIAECEALLAASA